MSPPLYSTTGIASVALAYLYLRLQRCNLFVRARRADYGVNAFSLLLFYIWSVMGDNNSSDGCLLLNRYLKVSFAACANLRPALVARMGRKSCGIGGLLHQKKISPMNL